MDNPTIGSLLIVYKIAPAEAMATVAEDPSIVRLLLAEIERLLDVTQSRECDGEPHEIYLRWEREPRADLPKAMVLRCARCGRRIDSFRLDDLLPLLLEYRDERPRNARAPSLKRPAASPSPRLDTSDS